MRRILFFLAFAIVDFAANAQSTVYVVFTSTDNQSALNGAWHSKMAPDSQLGREITAHVISLICESSNKCFTFVSEDNVAPIKMSKARLNTREMLRLGCACAYAVKVAGRGEIQGDCGA